MDTPESIINEALALPEEERLDIVDALLASIYKTSDEIDQAWKVELERRMASVESGEATLIPAEEVFAELRRRYGKP